MKFSQIFYNKTKTIIKEDDTDVKPLTDEEKDKYGEIFAMGALEELESIPAYSEKHIECDLMQRAFHENPVTFFVLTYTKYKWAYPNMKDKVQKCITDEMKKSVLENTDLCIRILRGFVAADNGYLSYSYIMTVLGEQFINDILKHVRNYDMQIYHEIVDTTSSTACFEAVHPAEYINWQLLKDPKRFLSPRYIDKYQYCDWYPRWVGNLLKSDLSAILMTDESIFDKYIRFIADQNEYGVDVNKKYAGDIAKTLSDITPYVIEDKDRVMRYATELNLQYPYILVQFITLYPDDMMRWIDKNPEVFHLFNSHSFTNYYQTSDEFERLKKSHKTNMDRATKYVRQYAPMAHLIALIQSHTISDEVMSGIKQAIDDEIWTSSAQAYNIVELLFYRFCNLAQLTLLLTKRLFKDALEHTSNTSDQSKTAYGLFLRAKKCKKMDVVYEFFDKKDYEKILETDSNALSPLLDQSKKMRKIFEKNDIMGDILNNWTVHKIKSLISNAGVLFQRLWKKNDQGINEVSAIMAGVDDFSDVMGEDRTYWDDIYDRIREKFPYALVSMLIEKGHHINNIDADLIKSAEDIAPYEMFYATWYNIGISGVTPELVNKVVDYRDGAYTSDMLGKILKGSGAYNGTFNPDKYEKLLPPKLLFSAVGYDPIGTFTKLNNINDFFNSKPGLKNELFDIALAKGADTPDKKVKLYKLAKNMGMTGATFEELQKEITENIFLYLDTGRGVDSLAGDIRQLDMVDLKKLEKVMYLTPAKIPHMLKTMYIRPRQRAEEYNRTHEKLFLHTTGDVVALHEVINKGKIAEICASSIDAHTVFYSDRGAIIGGQGAFTLLYDFDCYSYIDYATGKRYATAAGIELPIKKIDDYGLIDPFDQKKRIEQEHSRIGGGSFQMEMHYDEGFVDITKASILFVATDNKKQIAFTKKTWPRAVILTKNKVFGMIKKGTIQDFMYNLLDRQTHITPFLHDKEHEYEYKEY
jgi:hypothetical protein